MSAKALTAILPVLLVLLLLTTSSQAYVEALPFEDHFEGSVDPMKWTAMQNVNSTSYPAYGGSITVSNSAVTLSSDGSSFPCIYTAENFFPSGDFALEFDIKYIRLAGCETGLWISSGNFQHVTNMPYGNVFQVWADTHEEWGSGTKVFLLGQRIHFEAPNWDNHSLSKHLLVQIVLR
jgi:hypothetical protein